MMEGIFALNSPHRTLALERPQKVYTNGLWEGLMVALGGVLEDVLGVSSEVGQQVAAGLQQQVLVMSSEGGSSPSTRMQQSSTGSTTRPQGGGLDGGRAADIDIGGDKGLSCVGFSLRKIPAATMKVLLLLLFFSLCPREEKSSLGGACTMELM